jgi:hypothetical protein
MATDSTSTRNPTIGTSVVEIAKELLPSQRKSISIVNTSSGGQIITVAHNADAASGVGTPLSPGGHINDSADGNAVDSYFPSNFNYTAISSAVGGTLAIIERVGKEVR